MTTFAEWFATVKPGDPVYLWYGPQRTVEGLEMVKGEPTGAVLVEGCTVKVVKGNWGETWYPEKVKK